MSKEIYTVCLSVPLGERNGILYIHELNGKVTGWLEVMKQRNTFYGSLSKSGHIVFSGELRTLISTVQYTATGVVCGRKVSLNLKTKSGENYSVSGEETTFDEEIL